MKQDNLIWVGALIAGAYFLMKSGILDKFKTADVPGADEPVTIGLLETPVMGAVQAYGIAVTADSTSNPLHNQRIVNLTTTPGMREPAIVQARGIIEETSNIDVGKLMQSIGSLMGR